MPDLQFNGFSIKAIEFLADLRANNERDWFQEHKDDYERWVREPALDFIAAFSEPLAKFAPSFVAMPKKVGGSLMRPYRDIRFSRDKTPLKTNVGIQFRHELGKDVHAPGYYFHFDPDNVFIGAGIWRPDSSAVGRIRAAIVDRPAAWRRVMNNKNLKQRFELSGSSLTRPPRGFAKDHPLIDDLKRKDFIAISNMDHESLTNPNVVAEIAAAFKSATPLMKFLCAAIGVPF
ncbi:MAG: DUF2461 domain-containing protein [Gammaproteobacteria bacterium]